MRHWRGFTILELMIAVAVLGFLAILAVPNFNQMIARNHLSAASNDLVVALLTARSEAVKRECRVTVTSVTSDSWDDGWTANVLSNIDGCTVQQIVSHEVSSNSLTITPAGNIGYTVTYDPEGRAVSLAGVNADFFTLTVDDHDPATPDPAKVVCLTLFGRPYVPDTPPYPYIQSGADCS